MLRIAIGWHLFCEGWSKLDFCPKNPWRSGTEKDWSADGYLRASSGPLAPYYREHLLDDPGGLEHLSTSLSDKELDEAPKYVLAELEKEWKTYAESWADFYGATSERQKQKIQGRLDERKRVAEVWMQDKWNREGLVGFMKMVRKHRDRERRFSSLAAFEKDEFRSVQADLPRQWGDYTRLFNGWMTNLKKSLTSGEPDPYLPAGDLVLQLGGTAVQGGLPVGVLFSEKRLADKPGGSLYNRGAILTEEQQARGDYKAGWTDWRAIDWVNFLTRWGLVVMGGCLILGLFTRLAAFFTVLFLLNLYLTMPPWPGLPGMSVNNGHYLFVNPHIIEIVAVLAAAASGRWWGVDRFIHWSLFSCCRRAEAPARPVSEGETIATAPDKRA